MNINIKYESKDLEGPFSEASVSPVDYNSDLQGGNFTITRECRTINLVNSKQSISSEGENFLSMSQEISPLLKMNIKGEEDNFMQGHINPTGTLPHRLTQTVPPEPQHLLPPPSPHSGPPPSIGPPTPLGPGMGPPTPGMGPPTPGIGPPTPGMGPPTPGMGPPTPGMGPPTPGMGPPTPMTPGMMPLTPGGPNSVGQLTAGPLTPTYNTQPQLRPLTPTLGNQNMSPLTPNIDQTMQPALGTQMLGRPITPNQVPLVDPQSVNVSSVNMGLHHIDLLNGLSNPVVSQDEGRGRQASPSSAEEEVNRISAMLMKEAEAFPAPPPHPLPQYHRPGSSDVIQAALTSHDIVEASGLAGGDMQLQGTSFSGVYDSISASPHSKVSLSAPHPSQAVSQLGSLPHSSSETVSMSNMSMATIKRIHTDLLATVSESDLNDILNATPDTPLHPNNPQPYKSGNNVVQFSDNRTVLVQNNFGESSQVNNQGLLQYSNEPMSMPVVEQMSSNILDINRQQSSNSGTTGNSFNSDNLRRGSQFNNKNSIKSETVSHIVDTSVKGIGTGSSLLESQLAGLLQQPSSSNNFQTSGTIPALNMSSLQTPASQGITVVIGSSHDSNTTPVSLSLTSLAASFKKSALVSHQNDQRGHTSIQFQENEVSSRENVNTSHDHYPSATPIHIQEPTILQTIATTRHQKVVPNTNVQQSLQHISGQQLSQIQVQSQSSQQTSTYIQPPQQATPSMTVAPPTPSPNRKSSKKKKPADRRFLPLKDREYDPEIHCGAIIKETGKPCTRSLTCKAHSLTLRRNVTGRSKKFDELLLDHKAAKDAQAKASKPAEAAANLVQVSLIKIIYG